MTNKEFAQTSPVFRAACALAGIDPPTARQASKRQRQQGRARRYRNEAVRIIAERKKEEAGL
jgi:hypothetical protein